MIREVGRALFAAGQEIENEAKGLIVAGSVTGKRHVPSKPGEAPNANWRTLDGNIETNQVARLVVEVSSNAPYASDLELGTSKMAARPYMAPARDAKRKEVEQLVRRAVDKVVRESKSGDS